MRRFFLDNENLKAGTLIGDEFQHASNVLRLKIDDQFVAFVNDEYDYLCKITQIHSSFLKFEILNKTINHANPKLNITIFQALIKGDKMEFLVQKLTEIGVTSFVPIYTKNCDVKQNTHKLQRLEKIAISACKQCGRSKILEVNNVLILKDVLKKFNAFDLILFANETEKAEILLNEILEKNKQSKSIAIIVGPEGGWDPTEIELLKANCTSISLGKRILRTETAGIYLCSIVSNFFGV